MKKSSLSYQDRKIISQFRVFVRRLSVLNKLRVPTSAVLFFSVLGFIYSREYMSYWGIPFPADVSGFFGLLAAVGVISLSFCFLFVAYAVLVVFTKIKEIPVNVTLLVLENPGNSIELRSSLWQILAFLLLPSGIVLVSIFWSSLLLFLAALLWLVFMSLIKACSNRKVGMYALIEFSKIFVSALLVVSLILSSIIFIFVFVIGREIVVNNISLYALIAVSLLINVMLATPFGFFARSVAIWRGQDCSFKNSEKRRVRDGLLVFFVMGLVVVSVLPEIGIYPGEIAMRTVGFASVSPVVYTISSASAQQEWPKRLIADCEKKHKPFFIFPATCEKSRATTKPLVLLFQGGGAKYVKISDAGSSFVYEIPRVGRIALIKKIPHQH